VNNNVSGPDGVTSHGIWIYAGDGNSTLKVIDLRQFPPNGIVQSVSTGGTTRVDEMALTLDGTLLLAANNAEDPPFATLFNANGDSMGPSNVTKKIKVMVDPTIIPSGFGLSLEQPTWEPSTQRFYTSIPVIDNNHFSAVTVKTLAQSPPTAVSLRAGRLQSGHQYRGDFPSPRERECRIHRMWAQRYHGQHQPRWESRSAAGLHPG
jgi:hypothetical protein